MISTEVKIDGSKTLPAITFSNGKLNIIGRSIPHINTKEWFEPLLQAMYAYSLEPKEITEIDLYLDYINSDSNRALMSLLIIAEKLYNRGKQVLVRWHYKNNDEGMYDQGNIFKSLIEVPFSFEPVD